VYLSHTIDLLDVFWSIPVIKYGTRSNGVIKKQIKIHSSSQEEMDDILRKVQEYVDDGFYVEQQNLKAVNTNTQQCPNKFKDVRKVSIGLCRKDILTQRTKQKSAFYNCFVVIMRVLYEDVYRDVHVKVFNTGKMEIPGMSDDNLFTCVLQEIINLLQPYYDETLTFQTEKCETVLINSNFYTGFHINRDKLFDILKYTYQINASYDPCSYPGIQCKYNTQLSFMIFRTGSVLIVGKSCDEELNTVYEFLKTLLMKHHDTICERNEYGNQDIAPKTKKEIKVVKIRKRSFMKNMITNSLTPK
jgi:TATA-box binding protein (TBP) (component of TFIID and TFIIIB)